jgi:Protein of unknown function (DUF4058)
VTLLDHFHPPLSERRPWESFHAAWASTLANALNHDLLPPGYVALEHVHRGAAIEIDVGSFADSTAGGQSDGRGTATATRPVWLPAAEPLQLPASFPPGCTVEILSTEGGRTLVAAIELVSPANKDRARHRRLFAAKCATYLSRGIGLIIVDVVTSRLSNLHNELIDLLDLGDQFRMPSQQWLYSVAYRPLRVEGADRIDTWPVALAVGGPLPTMPLSLEAEECIPVDLGAAYAETCQHRRIAEVLG